MDWLQKVTRSAVFGGVVGRDGDFSLSQEWRHRLSLVAQLSTTSVDGCG